MYRVLLPLLLCQAVAAAPQAKTDSDITYVKLQPPIEAPTAPTHYRESRIENLPLTIPGNISLERGAVNMTEKREPEDESVSRIVSSDVTLPESSNLSEITALPDAAALSESEEIDSPKESGQILADIAQPERTLPDIAQPDRTLPDIAQPERVLPDIAQPERTLPEKADAEDELLEAHGSDLTDTVPAETYQSERRGRTYESSETTDIFDEPTERYEETTQIPEVPRKKPPKFVPKLSYFQKPQVFVSFPTNSIEKSTKRRFRSNCRCEKIWNCPKLQISVPRCPNEYFLCCF